MSAGRTHTDPKLQVYRLEGAAHRDPYRLFGYRLRKLKVSAMNGKARTLAVAIRVALSLLFAGPLAIAADLPRSLLKEPPRVLGRPVKELVLNGTVPVGQVLPPGLPTTTTYKMTPNRFRPVAEDAEGVYYQAVGPLQKHLNWMRGGVYMSKTYPDMLSPYRGDASNVRLPVGKWKPLHPGHARKFRIAFGTAEKSAATRQNSG